MTTLLIKYVFHLPCAFIASHHISFDINSTIYGELLCAKGGSILLQFNIKAGGQRIATMLMYLSDNVEGGETYFPMVDHQTSE